MKAFPYTAIAPGSTHDVEDFDEEHTLENPTISELAGR